MRLKADFVNDWLKILREILSNHWGYDATYVTKEDLPLVFFNAEKRRPASTPRIVRESDAFSCPIRLEKGWMSLRHLVESGADLTAHLSKLIEELDNKDSMLNDWGIHHFHLGVTMKGAYTERTGSLLFALVTDEHFYAIGVYQHGSWADADIIETLHRNWPDLIEQYKIKNVAATAANRSRTERKYLRRISVNSFVTVADGTVYGPLGGGMLSSGYNLKARIQADYQKVYLQELEQALEYQLPDLKSEFVKHGYAGEEEVEAKLEITEDQYVANFSEYGFSVELVGKEENFKLL